MLRKVIYFFLLIFVSLNLFAQEKVQLNNLNPNDILRSLFEVKIFNRDGKGRWKPNVYERYKMPVSDDGYCYTGIDTILYTSFNNEMKAVVIFESIEYNNELRSDCHGCNVMLSVATFTKNSGLWELTEFEKIFGYTGFWGELRSDFEIIKLGTKLQCLVFYNEGSSNMGSSSPDNTTFYDLGGNGYNEIFSYESSDSNDNEIRINYIKSSNYYKIELVTLRSNKQILKRQLYNFSESLGKYVPINVKAKTSMPKL